MSTIDTSLTTNAATLQSASQKQSEPYTATASLNADGTFDTKNTVVTGDRTTGLFDTKGKTAGMTLQKDDFLKLLVTQLQNQDPLSPTDDTQFMQQLTEMEQVESSNNIQTSVDTLTKAYQTAATAQSASAATLSNNSAVSLIGKQVKLRQTTVQYAGTPATLQVHLGSADSGSVQLLDATGTVVKTLQASGKDADNSASVTWDGTTDTGTPAAQGPYTINIVGQDTNTDLYAYVKDTVQGVQFTSTGATVTVGGQELPIANIMDVTGGSASSQFSGLSTDSALTLLGKDVKMYRTSVTSTGAMGQNISINANVNGLSTEKLQVLDSQGTVIANLSPATNADGSTAINADGTTVYNWNGISDDGQTLEPAGQYRIQLADQNSNPSLYCYLEGPVTAVNTSAGVPYLQVNGQYVPLGNIFEVETTKS